MIELVSAYHGFQIPISELTDDLHRRGWTVTKVYIKDKQYVAEAKNPHGEKREAYGSTDNAAVGALLLKVMRTEAIRAHARRQAGWDPTPLIKQWSAVAQAYASANVYEPKAATAWMELASDCANRAATIKAQIDVEYTPDPTPYETINDLVEDVTKKRHVDITTAAAHHPVWSYQQMLDYRTVVTVLGHAVAGGDWGYHGTCLAFAQLAPNLSERAQSALYTELVGQSAYSTFYGAWGPQKIVFLQKELEKIQEQENGPGHHGVHPSQNIVPVALPKVFGSAKTAMPYDFNRDHWWHDGDCAPYAVAHQALHPELQFGYHADPKFANEEDPDGITHVFTHDNQYAYDVYGRHALPYKTAWGDFERYNIGNDAEQTPFSQEKYWYSPETIQEAHDHIAQYGDPMSDEYNQPGPSGTMRTFGSAAPSIDPTTAGVRHRPAAR